MSRMIPIESEDDRTASAENAAHTDCRDSGAGEKDKLDNGKANTDGGATVETENSNPDANAAATDRNERQDKSQTPKTAETHAAEGGGDNMNRYDRENSGDGKFEESANSDSPVDIEKLKHELEEKDTALREAEKQKNEYIEHLQRMKAEFENFKKRTMKEKSDTICFANEKLLGRLLPVVDNLRRGCEAAAEHVKDERGKSILKGIEMVEKQLVELLDEFGAKPFDSLGEVFDSNIHEALYTVPRDDVEDNTVVEEIEKGYMLNEKLLRPAKVAVSRATE